VEGARRSWNFLKAGANCTILGTSAIDYFTSDVRKGKNINVKRTKSFKKLCSFETVHLWLTGTLENCVCLCLMTYFKEPSGRAVLIHFPCVVHNLYYILHTLTDSMRRNTCWEDDSPSANKDISRLLWNPNVNPYSQQPTTRPCQEPHQLTSYY
jgi:hypothetical protein